MKHQLFKNKYSNTYSNIVKEYPKHVYLQVFKLERSEPELGYALWPKKEFTKWHNSAAFVDNETIRSPREVANYISIFQGRMGFGAAVS